MRARARRVWLRRFAIVTATLVLAGCRSMPLPRAPVEDVAVELRQREAAMIEEFEQKRTRAEFEAAKGARQRGDSRNCQAILEQLLRRDPGHRDGRMLLSHVYFEQGRHADAIAQLETAVADFPNDPKVHEATGALLADLGRHEESQAHLERARYLSSGLQTATTIPLANASPINAAIPSPGPEATVVNASHAEPCVEPTAATGQNRFSPGDAASAEDVGGAGWGDGTDADRLLDMAETALINGDTGRGLALFQRAAATDPNNPQIPIFAAVAALRHGYPGLAAVLAEESRVRFPQDNSLLRVLGVAYYRQGDLESSQLVLLQALSLDKSDALAYFLLGCTHAKLEQFEAARECFAEAQRIDPRLTVRP
ncbi:MAG: tetratricopeptide repeat protein [Pirellulaceae bacterium]|nr:tetratricopeptide repeat protein [Pirellulaceae bacterium]